MAKEKSDFQKKKDTSLEIINANRKIYDPITRILDKYLANLRGMTDDELTRRISYYLNEYNENIRECLELLATPGIKLSDDEGNKFNLIKSQVTVWKFENDDEGYA